MLDTLLTEGKKKYPNSFIRTTVSVNDLTIEAHAKVGDNWVDQSLTKSVTRLLLTLRSAAPRSALLRTRLCASPEMVAAAPLAAYNLKNLSHLSFSSQNCNSLNISTLCPKQGKK
jgi:hypothetical protein